jgi:hypothetical protein
MMNIDHLVGSEPQAGASMITVRSMTWLLQNDGGREVGQIAMAIRGGQRPRWQTQSLDDRPMLILTSQVRHLAPIDLTS